MNRMRQTFGDRGQWANKREYILVIAGNVVGLGNVWRFPYLCYKNGGGAFLVPYVLLTVVCAMPMFLLETSIGQYTQEGFITCWRKMCPLAQGIGYGQMIIILLDFIYILIEAWAFFYLFFAFKSHIPWATCDNYWNTDNCKPLCGINSSTNLTANQTKLKNFTSAATEFWERRMLQMSDSLEELGSVSWELALCLLISWTFCYFCIWKSIKSSGKVAYFTATFPYAMLLILLIRGVSLPGASEGIYYYLHPDLNQLVKLEVWKDTISQVMFSYGLTGGTLIVLASHNDYQNNCYRDVFLLTLLNGGTSFIAGFVVFSVLGFMAHELGVSVDAVAASGPGLAFIAYPQATAMMPLPQFWTVCFFLMLIMLTVDTHFTGVEVFITSMSDLYPGILRAPVRRQIFVLITCLFGFFAHLIFVTQGGIYVFQLVDFYGTTRFSQNFLVLSICLAVGWIFGADNVVNIIEDMTGQRPSIFFKMCWKYFTPLLLLGTFGLYVVDFRHLRFDGHYVYPDWAYSLGWIMMLSSVLMIPLWAVGQMCWQKGTFRQRLMILCRPDDDLLSAKRTKDKDGTTAELMPAAT